MMVSFPWRKSVEGAVGDGLGRRRLADGPLEEFRVRPGMQAQRIGKSEVPEVLLAERTALDHLPGFFDRLDHVDDIPMRYVGADHGAKLSAHRVHVAGESPFDQRVVRLAAEIEAGDEQVADVL